MEEKATARFRFRVNSNVHKPDVVRVIKHKSVMGNDKACSQSASLLLMVSSLLGLAACQDQRGLSRKPIAACGYLAVHS